MERYPRSPAPHIGLVDFHATAEPFSAGPHHRAPQLVQQRPGGTVASQTQDALQSQCARPVFLAGHPPHGPKPGAQRQARVLENRARRHRSLIIALPTPQQAPPAVPSSPPSTAGTHKTLWPAQLHQILATRLLSGKTPLKLLQRPRVVLHSPACYMLGSRESSAYPDNSNLGATLSPPFASLPPAPASTAASPSPPPAVGTGNRRRGESRAPRRRTVPACRLHRDVTKSWPAMARKNRRPLSQPVIRKSHALVDKVWREDFLLEAWGIVRLPTQSSSS